MEQVQSSTVKMLIGCLSAYYKDILFS